MGHSLKLHLVIHIRGTFNVNLSRAHYNKILLTGEITGCSSTPCFQHKATLLVVTFSKGNLEFHFVIQQIDAK